jgi:hypothetical protein
MASCLKCKYYVQPPSCTLFLAKLQTNVFSDVSLPRRDFSGLEDIQDRLQIAEHVNRKREEDLKTLRSNFLQILKSVLQVTNQTNRFTS